MTEDERTLEAEQALYREYGVTGDVEIVWAGDPTSVTLANPTAERLRDLSFEKSQKIEMQQRALTEANASISLLAKTLSRAHRAWNEFSNWTSGQHRAAADHKLYQPMRKALWPIMYSLSDVIRSDAGVKLYCEQAVEALNDPYMADEDVMEAAEQIIESGALGEGPFTVPKFRGFYRGMSVEQMLAEFSVDDFDD